MRRHSARALTTSVAVMSLLVGLGAFSAVRDADDRPLRQVIDQAVRALWQREKTSPAPQADDTEFIRRAYLDLVGTIPTYDEAKGFLEDRQAGKREKLIDKLLADPRFAAA